jgi:predicted TIM-barrel fold metal-dependent hydrolase
MGNSSEQCFRQARIEIEEQRVKQREAERPTRATDRREFLKWSAFCAAGSLAATTRASHEVLYAADGKRPIIDTHMHVWANDQRPYPFAHPYAKDYQGMPHDGTVEMLIDDMDRNGCTHCVLVQTICHGWDNSYLADCVRRHPQRFKGHGLIDPTDPQVADKLRYWTKEHGLHGMRFSPMYYQNDKFGGDGWVDAAAAHPLWRTAEQLGSVFNFFIAARQLPKLETMVRAHPDVPVIVDHLAQIDLGADDPEPDFRLLLAMAKYPSVRVKVSELSSVSKSREYPFRDAYPYVKRVYEAFGPDRLLFGTGYPGAARAAYQRPTLRAEIDLIDKEIPFFTPGDRDKILGGNAARLWRFEV